MSDVLLRMQHQLLKRPKPQHQLIHIRLTPTILRDASNERKARYASAGEVIMNTKREKLKMMNWLYEKGIRFGPSTQYYGFELQ